MVKFCFTIFRKDVENYLLASFGLIIFYWLVSLLKLLTVSVDRYHDLSGISQEENVDIILFHDYQKWLLVSIFVSVRICQS